MLPPIGLVYASFGHGHETAARALGEALSALAPNVPYDYVDVLSHFPGGGQFFSQSYRLLASRAPLVWKALYGVTNLPVSPTLGDLAAAPFRRLANHGLGDLLSNSERKVLVCTHPFSALLVPARSRLSPRLWIVLTDYRAHSGWACRRAERFYVPDEAARDDLARVAVTPEAIHVAGMPVRHGFQTVVDKAVLRGRRALDPNRFTVLLMPHWHNRAVAVALLRHLLKITPPIQLAVVAGRDAVFRALLSETAGDRAVVYGWVDDIPDLMACADVIITKPGGQTISEAIASDRKLIMLDPIPGQEELNAAHVARLGLGIIARSIEDVTQHVRALAAGRAAPTGTNMVDRHKMADRNATAAERIARDILSAALD